MREVREEVLGMGRREFSREVGVPATTVQGNEQGKPPRRQTAWRYAEALRRRGIDPNEVREIRDTLGEIYFVDLDPEALLAQHAVAAWEELTRGLVRAGRTEEELRELLRRIVEQFGEEGRQAREQIEQESREFTAEEMAAEAEEECRRIEAEYRATKDKEETEDHGS